jgi:hypothetical protein
MRSDADVKRDVEAELHSGPSVDATDVAVVTEGVVTLTGFVRSHRKRNAAEAAAKRIAGLVAVVNDIEVRVPLVHTRDPIRTSHVTRWKRSGATCQKRRTISRWWCMTGG